MQMKQGAKKRKYVRSYERLLVNEKFRSVLWSPTVMREQETTENHVDKIKHALRQRKYRLNFGEEMNLDSLQAKDGRPDNC